MAKITLTEPLSGYNLAAINANFGAIEQEFQDKVLYRNNPAGEPNALSTDIDANSKRIYNLPVPTLSSEAARLADIQNALSGGAANLITSAPVGGVAATNVQAAIQELDSEKVSLTQLAASTGASLVGYMPPAVGAVLTTQSEINSGLPNLFWFGGSTTATAAENDVALSKAIAFSQLTKRRVQIDEGVFNFSQTVTAGTYLALVGAPSQTRGGNNDPSAITGGTIFNWQGTDAAPTFLVDHYVTTHALIQNIRVHVPVTYAGKAFHFKGSGYFSQGWTYKHEVDNLAVYRKGAISPEATAAVGFYWDCTDATAADGRALFGIIANNLSGFNLADLIKVEIANNTLGVPGKDNWCNSNVFSNIEGYQVYRGLNLIGGTTAGNSIARNTFANITIQPGLGLGGLFAPEIITGSGGARVSDNVFLNVVTWDAPLAVVATSWANINTFIGTNVTCPGDVISQGFMVAGGGTKRTGAMQAYAVGSASGSGDQFVGYDLTVPDKKIRMGYDSTLSMGYIQAGHAGVANQPIILSPNGGGAILVPANGVSPTTNGHMLFEYVSDTNITIKFKGGDGIVRKLAFTLAP